MSLAFADDARCTNPPDLEFDGSTWYSEAHIYESWAEAGETPGTFVADGDAGVFTAEDGKIVNYRRETPGNFRELECKLGFTPG